ncbi:precorrin-6A/cobalt-precorrin-6A reductase [Marivita hallyeonensis]|nr:precorrin-6A/cobalt-precorrin-6A reductase [Marivita hallyeonensis]
MRDFNGTDRPGAGQIAILGGSAEARDLAQQLGARARLWLPARDRVTGQGRARQTGFAEWASGASALIIAPHPCDVESLRLGASMAGALSIPHLTLMRPAWRPSRRDHWVSVRTVREAARHIPVGARVLVTLGRPVLPEMSAFRHAHAFVRQLSRHNRVFPLRHGRFLHGDPPFTVAHEITVMRRFRIDAVLTRNAGGTGGWPKVAAARALGLPVYMIARERVPTGPTVSRVEDAVRWSEAALWLDV